MAQGDPWVPFFLAKAMNRMSQVSMMLQIGRYEVHSEEGLIFAAVLVYGIIAR